MMDELRGVDALQTEIERARDKLRGFNENIKKLTGRDLRDSIGQRFNKNNENAEDNFGAPTGGRLAGRGRGRLFGMARRGIMEENNGAGRRRFSGPAFSRLGPYPAQGRRQVREDSPDEEELPNKLSVHSSVVSTSRDSKNREQVMQEQTKDKEGMQRNRRMFGLLLGTLTKFKTESKSQESKEEQRKRIDQKLDEVAEREKKKFQQERKQLMEEAHLEQSKISRLEQKMEMVQEHADREVEMQKLKNFIITKAKPRIFWKPKEMNSAAKNRLQLSKKVVDEMLKEGQEKLDKEIQEVMKREVKREERIKMRLKEDGLFQDAEDELDDDNDKREPVLPEGGDLDSDHGQENIPRKMKRRVVVEEQRADGFGSDGEIDEPQIKKVRNVTEVEEEEAESPDEYGPGREIVTRDEGDQHEAFTRLNEETRKHAGSDATIDHALVENVEIDKKSRSRSDSKQTRNSESREVSDRSRKESSRRKERRRSSSSGKGVEIKREPDTDRHGSRKSRRNKGKKKKSRSRSNSQSDA